MEMKRELYHYRESGLNNVWLKNWPILVCSKCKTKLPLLPDPDKTAKEITRALVSQTGRLDGDSIVFLRKAMHLNTAGLAKLLGVDRVTVSRWENNKRNIEFGLDLRLRRNAVNRILPEYERTQTRDVLDEILISDYHPEIAIGDTKIQVAIESPASVQPEGKLLPLAPEPSIEPGLAVAPQPNTEAQGFSAVATRKRR
jgi:transcriptional regulator with XRE-family HTH domain